MIQIDKSGKVRFGGEVQLTPRQVHKLGGLWTSDKQSYIMSLFGLNRKRIMVPKYPSRPTDKLLTRPRNSFLKLLEQAKNNSNDINHKPLGVGNWVGIELEFLVPEVAYEPCLECEGSGQFPHCADPECSDMIDCHECNGEGQTQDYSGSDQLMNRIRQALNEAKIYRASVRRDGSLSGDGMSGVEVTLLLNIDRGFGPLEQVCALLKTQFKATVNKSCGMHVHFDYSGKPSEQVMQAARRAKKFLPFLSKIVAPSRIGNTYCALSVSRFRGSRYHAINLTSYNKHGTIEVRLHQGTLDAGKVQNWVKLMQRIFTTDVRGEVKDVQDVLDKLNLPDALAAYIDERVQTFSKPLEVPKQVLTNTPRVLTQVSVDYATGTITYTVIPNSDIPF